MGRPKGEGRITTSVTISPEFYKLAKDYNLSFSESVRIGMALMLAERGVKDYDNNLNLYRKMILIKDNLEKTTQELNELKDKYAKS